MKNLIFVSLILISPFSFANSNWVFCPQLSWFEGNQLKVGDSVVDSYPIHPVTWKLEQIINKANGIPEDSIPAENATPELSSWTYDWTEATIEKQNGVDQLSCHGWINENTNIYTFTISALAKDYSSCIVNNNYTFYCN